MIALDWNCRGCGNSLTVRRIKELILSQNPTVVFLVETKSPTLQVINKLRLNRDWNAIGCDGTGNSGGLLLMWRKNVKLKIFDICNRWIVYFMDHSEPYSIGICVLLYGEPNRMLRTTFWEKFVTLINSLNGPIVVLGDWNCLWFATEKRGGQPIRLQEISPNRCCLDQCQLFDMGSTGPPHTWTNGQQFPHRISEWLNKAASHSMWRLKFPNASLQVLQFSGSDHYPILLHLSPPRGRFLPKPFHFEWFWKNYEQCQQIFEKEWQASSCALNQKLNNLICPLQHWSRHTFRETRQKIKTLKQQIQSML